MISVKRVILLVGLLGGLACGSVTAQGYADRSVAALSDYFDLLASGNYDIAPDLWWGPSLKRGTKFGIEFTGIPMKFDCVSPIVRDLDLYRPYLISPVQQVKELDGRFARLEFNQMIGTNRVIYYYYTYYDGRYFWLVYPQDCYAQDWSVSETKYFRIHRDPLCIPPNQIALDEADRFVERIVRELEIPKADFETIAREKIDYFYCHDDSTVMQITGYLVKGMLDQASNDMISAFFPHYHELMHLLVNIKLKKLPYYTQPIMKEGLAVAMGGRWGKEPEALMELGAFLYLDKIIDFDSLLTMRFYESSATADIAYPMTGLFSAYLWERLGPDGYVDVYRVLSGSNFNQVYSMTINDVKMGITAVTGDPDWMTLDSLFTEYAREVRITNRGLLPGTTGKGKPVYEDDKVTISRDGDWLNFRFSLKPGDSLSGNLLFNHVPELQNVVSDLFMEQYLDGRAFPGARYGLRFDRNEAGLYDYATNYLVAKYVFSFSPSDDYINTAGNVIAMRLKKELVGDIKFEAEDLQLLNQ
ncbi:MAG TPA: hypothetical protein PLF13_11080 [candidate division Zixibacteria bacterium]|nr:hypothetical protein [candidate division Zixibacteria bacterium]